MTNRESKNDFRPGKAAERINGLTKLGAIAALTGLAIAGCAPTTEKPPAATTSVAPTASEAPSPDKAWGPEYTVEEVEIPAGLSAEELGKAFVQRLNDWYDAGIVMGEDLTDRIDYDDPAAAGWDVLIPGMVKENGPVFAEGLFVDGWESDPDLVKYVDAFNEANRVTLANYVGTAWSTDPTEEIYYRWDVFDSATELSNDGTTRTLEVKVVSRDNAESNEVPDSELLGGDGFPNTWTVTFINVDGTERISMLAAAGS
jgi:hypothetical protein